ncbi:MAG: hypothetical protein VB093_15815 [Propionicimonas sp.]|jgi:hypothetical protein|nr:hypothetical protein [Propionicimonas sp.]
MAPHDELRALTESFVLLGLDGGGDLGEERLGACASSSRQFPAIDRPQMKVTIVNLNVHSKNPDFGRGRPIAASQR